MKIKDLIKKIPPIGLIYGLIYDFFYWRKHYRKLFLHISPGHFYSPVPDIDWVQSNRETLYPEKVTLSSDVDIQENSQKALLREVAKHFPDFKFPTEPSEDFRYHENDMFGFGSGLMLFGMIRHFQPKRIIEIGSGHTSALMLDTNERFMNHQMELTFIEPNPERLHGLLKEDDRTRCTIFEKPAQDIPISYFQQLQKNDILFIDSSHVTKIGSDVNHIFFNILPLLNPGVIIHFHDIYWPFEYPLAWIELGRAWNEAYLLRAFLQYNDHFEILQFNQYLFSCFPEFYQEQTGLTGAGSSIWIRKKSNS
ncbi:MAG: class I SAM-dependent methyltransferase [Planctomycetes bacterium]|nr:class I SAM-dependent methyltransferase [Planctomycetota bacterium]